MVYRCSSGCTSRRREKTAAILNRADKEVAWQSKVRRRREVYLVNWRQLTGRACDWLPKALTRVIRAKRRRSLFPRSYARSRSVAAFFRRGRFPRLHLSETRARSRIHKRDAEKNSHPRPLRQFQSRASITIVAFGMHTLRFLSRFDEVAVKSLSRSIYSYAVVHLTLSLRLFHLFVILSRISLPSFKSIYALMLLLST